MASVSFAEVYQERAVAIQASQIAGNSLPMLDFLSRYGKFMPEQQLVNLAAEYFPEDAGIYASKEALLTSVLEKGLSSIDTGTGERTIDTLVSRVNEQGVTELRTIRSELFGNEGVNELYAQIYETIKSWQKASEVKGFAIITPVWRTY